jgi:hypothetical protein
MRHLAVSLAGPLLFLVLATAATAGSEPTRALADCGTAKVGGATVLTHCGPAKVAVTFGGKTYRISGGSCSVSAGFWTLLSGRQTLPRAKSMFTSLQGAFVGTPRARTYTHNEFTLSFQIPGADWVLAPGLPHKVTVTAGGKKGTFKGAFYTGSETATRPATGSWTC